MRSLTVWDIIRSCISRLLVILFIIVTIPVVIILLLLPQKWVFNSPILFWCARFFYWIMLKIGFVHVRYKGRENITKKPSILISNHQSSYDIPLIGHLVNGHPHLWLAWVNLMQSPLLRWFLPKMAVLVDMSSPKKGLRTLMQAIALLRDTDRHVIIFPEGARFTDGHVHPFFGGFAYIAKKLGRPVIPIRIFGANIVYPPRAYFARSYPITVVIGEPLYIREDEDEKAFIDRVRTWYDEQTED